MRLLPVTVVLGLFLPSLARATPCQVGTLQSYMDLASGCDIEDKTVFGFVDLGVIGGATAIPPGDILVTPLSTPGNPGLTLDFGASAGPSDLLESLFAFSVAVLPGGMPIDGVTLSLLGSQVEPDGVNTALLCLGTTDPACPTLETILLFDIGVDSELAGARAVAGLTTLDLLLDVVVDGGTGGSASLSSATIRFQEQAGVATVPEPALGLPLGLGLLALGLVRRSWRRAKGAPERGLAASLPVIAAALVLLPQVLFAANHREAPITALDHKADISDVYAFRSYGGANAITHVTFILCVDPLLEPANGPNWFPFDPDILYSINIDNNNDAVADIVFQFRFTTEQRLPNLFQGFAGVGSGAVAPGNSPPPVPPGTPIVPPRITAFDSVGLGLRQQYTVTMIKGGITTPLSELGGGPLYAVPANVGPRTMDYGALFNAGTYDLTADVRAFAGTTDDAFWVDLGGIFDTVNTAKAPPVLSAAEDAANVNLASDTVSGYAVNSIGIEVPIPMLTRTGAFEAATSPAATIGVWATTARPRTTVRRSPLPAVSSGTFHQVQRMGNPLINELLIGTGYKDRFSMDQPKQDAQFASFFLDPALARVVNALTGGAVAIPTPPRLDLLALVTYSPPIAATGTTAGPVADLLRLNTGVSPTPAASANRLGLLGGDPAGFPNGRRVMDDVTDITLRLVVGGILAGPPFNTSPINTKLGDGVNVNDAPYRDQFPYLASAPSGRSRRHVDPGEPFCTPLFGGGAACLP